MGALCDLLWEHFGHDEHQAIDRGGISWVGFYGHGETYSTPEHEMTLLVRRDKPACSPIGLFGACGQSLRRKSILAVRDVAALGEGYIACDPRDQSELVLPCIDERGVAHAVLDVDSFALGAFTLYDALMLAEIMYQAGLTSRKLTAANVEVF
jgi:putative methionine-R-sulfoxide reductase with GAF domain